MVDQVMKFISSVVYLFFVQGLIRPFEPFSTTNRFTTATVFGILAFEIIKIFEEFIFRTGVASNRGVLTELLNSVAIVLFLGYETTS